MIAPKHGFWTLQPLLQAIKIVVHASYLWLLGSGRSHWVPSRDCNADDSLIRSFECSNTRLFDVMCVSSHYRDAKWFAVLGCFLSICWNLGQTNGQIPSWIDCLLIFKSYNSRTYDRFLWRNTLQFASQRSKLAQLLLDFLRIGRPKQSIALFFPAHTHISMTRHLSRSCIRFFGSTSNEFFVESNVHIASAPLNVHVRSYVRWCY